MIDINDVFKEYVNSYDINNIKIKRKYDHSYRVKQLARDLSEYLNLDEDNKYLAELIGLLHDIGRFEQVKIYNSFVDYETIDHGDFGVKILFEDGLIRKFIKDNKYDNIIYNAIKNHNKLNIEPGLDEISLLHSKIIRDADKIDILYIKSNKAEKIVEEYGPTKEVEEDFFKNKLSENKKIVTSIDNVIRILSFLYDINYSFSYKYILDNKLIEKYYKTIGSPKILEKHFNYILKYVRKKSDENVR